MFSPPPGYVDFISDADTALPAELGRTLTVPRVGTVVARRTTPASAALLAMSASPDSKPSEQVAYLARFVEAHLGTDEVGRVYVEMMVGDMPSDAITLIARAVATEGTARPYVAVVSLAVMCGHHWRTIRQKLLAAGIADPMALPSMHVLLDYTESMAVEALASGEDGRREVDSLYRRLYGPTPEALSLNGDDYVPPGFSPEEVEASFDAFSHAAH